MGHKETIGGQAVIEGVMLRRKNTYTVAVRNPKGKITVTKSKIKDHRKGLLSIFKYPFFRGIYAMFEMLGIGMKTLIYSSNISLEEEEEKLSKRDIFWLITVSMLVAIGFFVVLPYFLTYLFGLAEHSRPILFNIVDAAIKTVFFIVYILAISRMKDVKRLFQYHGAEHKVVYCYEHNKKITVSNAKSFTTLHPRCGSSFIMLVIVMSIIIFSFIPLIMYSIFPALQEMVVLRFLVLITVRILIMLPIIAGLSYELLKLAGKHNDNLLFRIISWPGLMLQKLTTGEPDDEQIEVAIKAINQLL